MRYPFLALGLVANAMAQMAESSNDLVTALKGEPDLSSLLSAIQAEPGLANLLNKSGNITILAPTNAAFNKLSPDSLEGQIVASGNPEDIDTLLSYHVLVGLYPASAATNVPTFVKTTAVGRTIGGEPASNLSTGQNVGIVKNGQDVQFISGELSISTVTEANVKVGGKIIHKIDTVLRIPRNASTTASDFGLTAITGALTGAGLVETIDTAKDLTVFVPANEAFQAAGSAFQNASMETLQSVLAYHVVQGSVVFSTQVTNSTVASYGGQDLTLSVIDGTIFVNTAKVIIPNIILSNGVAHVIDVVLDPMATSVNRASLNPTAAPSPAFPSASSAMSVPFASSAPMASTTLSVPAVATTAAAVPKNSPGGGGNMGGGAAGSSSSASSASGAAMPHATADSALLLMGALLGGALVL